MKATTLQIAGRIVVATRATPRVMACLPSLEGRRTWLKAGGLSIEDTPHNRRVIEMTFDTVIETVEKKQAPKRQPIPLVLSKRAPDPHQVRAADAIGDAPFFGIFVEQGGGKTKIAIDRAVKAFCAGEIDAVLVLSKRGVHRQWIEEEIGKDCAIPWVGGFWDKKPINPKLLKVVDGLVWYAINWDAIKTKGGKEAVTAFSKAHSGRLMIIGDESHEIKNKSSARAVEAAELKPYSVNRMILTGTPIAKDLTDEWSQLDWLNEEILGCRYLTTFKAKYCILGGFEGRDVVGQKNMDEFNALTRPHTFRCTKAEMGMLPKRYTDWKFDLTKEQKRLIKSLKDTLKADLTSGAVIKLKPGISSMNKVQQMASGFLIDSETGKTHRLMPTSQNPRAMAMLDWLASGDGKAIIWSNFIEDKLIICEALSAAGISYVEYHGATSETDREASKRAFMDPGGAKVLVAGKSASTGLNLQGLCNRALYYSNTTNSIDRWQSEDRIHRIGTIGTCVFTDLIGKGSIDRRLRSSLLRKEGFARMTLGDVLDALEDNDEEDFAEVVLPEMVTDAISTAMRIFER